MMIDRGRGARDPGIVRGPILSLLQAVQVRLVVGRQRCDAEGGVGGHEGAAVLLHVRHQARHERPLALYALLHSRGTVRHAQAHKRKP